MIRNDRERPHDVPHVDDWADRWSPYPWHRLRRAEDEGIVGAASYLKRHPELVGKGPHGYTRSDARIHEEICERLAAGYLDATDVEVTVTQGEVVLAGTVREKGDRRIAEDLLEDVAGVRGVENRLKLGADAGRTS